MAAIEAVIATPKGDITMKVVVGSAVCRVTLTWHMDRVVKSIEEEIVPEMQELIKASRPSKWCGRRC